VVQGTGNWSEGGVKHVEIVLGPNSGRWTVVEHFHPERNFAVQFPSGAPGDFRELLLDYGETNVADVLMACRAQVSRAGSPRASGTGIR